MKTEKVILVRLFKNALLSLFIYALPVILMFITFYITGQRPWEKKSAAKASVTHHQK
jgi:preprotein translocase subunit YajC